LILIVSQQKLSYIGVETADVFKVKSGHIKF